MPRAFPEKPGCSVPYVEQIVPVAFDSCGLVNIPTVPIVQSPLLDNPAPFPTRQAVNHPGPDAYILEPCPPFEALTDRMVGMDLSAVVGAVIRVDGICYTVRRAEPDAIESENWLACMAYEGHDDDGEE